MKQFWYFMLSTEDSNLGDWHGLFFHYDKNKNTDYKCLKEVKCKYQIWPDFEVTCQKATDS